MPFLPHLSFNNPPQVPHSHHISSNISWQTMPFQIDSFLTLTPHAALLPTARRCLSFQLNSKGSCQAAPPYTFTLSSLCLAFDTWHLVTPIHRHSPFEFWYLPQAAPPRRCNLYLGWSVIPAQVSPPKWIPYHPLWALGHYGCPLSLQV